MLNSGTFKILPLVIYCQCISSLYLFSSCVPFLHIHIHKCTYTKLIWVSVNDPTGVLAQIVSQYYTKRNDDTLVPTHNIWPTLTWPASPDSKNINFSSRFLRNSNYLLYSHRLTGSRSPFGHCNLKEQHAPLLM